MTSPPAAPGLNFRGDWSKVLWSDKSPSEGDPTCLCSYCGALIPEDTCCLRCWTKDQEPVLEARFCDDCAEKYFGIQSFPDEGEDAFYGDERDFEP